MASDKSSVALWALGIVLSVLLAVFSTALFKLSSEVWDLLKGQNEIKLQLQVYEWHFQTQIPQPDAAGEDSYD